MHSKPLKPRSRAVYFMHTISLLYHTVMLLVAYSEITRRAVQNTDEYIKQ